MAFREGWMMDRRGFGIGLMVCLVLGAGLARGDDDKHKRVLWGRTVVRVEESVLVIAGDGADKGKELLVATDGGTKISLDGKAVALGDLKAGVGVTVTQVDGITVELQCRTRGK